MEPSFDAGDPLENLPLLISMAKWSVMTWGDAVAELDSPGQWAGSDEGGGTVVLNYRIKAWNEERDRLASLCKDAVKLGVAERQVRIAEQQV